MTVEDITENLRKNYPQTNVRFLLKKGPMSYESLSVRMFNHVAENLVEIVLEPTTLIEPA